jgi:hypothetical protein
MPPETHLGAGDSAPMLYTQTAVSFTSVSFRMIANSLFFDFARTGVMFALA